MTARILLVTTVHWPSTARLAGAFANAGERVDAVLPDGHVAARSRFLSNRHAYHPLFPVASLCRAVSRATPDLIVPCDDRALGQVLALAPKYPALIEHSLGRLQSYPSLVARSTFIAIARTLGIAAPESIEVRGEADLGALGFPSVLKADGSWGGDGVAILRNLDHAKAAYRRLATTPSPLRSLARAVRRRDPHFLHAALAPAPARVSLQRFVPGTPATTAFASWKGRVLATIHADVLETLHANGPATVLRRTESPAMEQAAIRLAEHFGLSGLHGLDFVRDGDGKPHLIEINPRATQSGAFAFGPGHDLAAALAGAMGQGARTRPLLTENPIIALFPQEWRRDANSAWFHTAYPDVPWDDPEVLRACLEPGETVPERSPSPERPISLTLRQAVGR